MRRYGQALRGIPRDSYVLSTKAGRVLRAGAPGSPQTTWAFDFSAGGARESFASSLDRLGLERVDILLVHDPDDHYREAVGGAFPVLMELRAQGRVGAIGAGMNQWQMELAFAREGHCDCLLLAGRYTLLDQTALPEFRAAALQFILAHPVIVSVIPGARSQAEVEENVKLVELPIPAALWADLKDAGLIAAAAPTPEA